MKWYELIEDLGDGASSVRRFKTEEEALNYEKINTDWCYSGCYSGVEEVDTDSKYFYWKEEYD
jgi:hypothetical protein